MAASDPFLGRCGVSPIVFNGLLYGGDMAPDVKQGDDAETFRLKAILTHASIDGVPVWQTPDLDSREARLINTLRDELGAAYDKVRFWRYCYLTVCAQFLVVAVAAVWGWAR